MDSNSFNLIVLSLWGDGWRLRLDDLLRSLGHRYTRQTFYNWQTGKHPVPEPVAFILNKQAKRKKSNG